MLTIYDQASVRLGYGVSAEYDLVAWFRLVMLLSRGHATYSGKTSPHWYDADAFFELLQATGDRAVRTLVADLDGCTGARAGQIAAPLKLL